LREQGMSVNNAVRGSVSQVGGCPEISLPLTHH
jgi:hypothetical protein